MRTSLTLVLLGQVCATAPARTITVNDADRTGRTDTRAILQKAIDSAPGGTLYLPKGTYLLDSYRPSTHPWKFCNLLVPSNVTIAGEPGTILLQGRHGRASLPARADYVETDVIAVGTPNYQEVTFQKEAFNGGWRQARPTRAGASDVSLADPSDLSGFAPGDWIAIYAATAGDVIPGETTRSLPSTALPPASRSPIRWLALSPAPSSPG